MNKRAFLFLTLFAVGLHGCEIQDLGVAFNPIRGGVPVVDLNEIDGEWNFNKIEVITDNGGLYSIEGREIVNVFANQGSQSTASVQRFLRNKMVFDAQSVRAYAISQATPYQGSWQYTPESEKLVLFADTQDSETYTINGLTQKSFAISTLKVSLAGIPDIAEQQTFDQKIAQQIGQKIVALKEPNAANVAKVKSVQLVIRYQR